MQQCWQKLSRGDWPEMAVLWLVLKHESESRSVVSDSLLPHGLYSPWNSPGQNTGVGSLSLLQGIFPAQGSNPGLPHCRQTLYHLSHQGIPSISWSLLKSVSIELVMLSNHLVLCLCLLCLPSVFPSIREFSTESSLSIRWPTYWSFSFSISPSNVYSGLISFRID